jgi:hypothetical protein
LNLCLATNLFAQQQMPTLRAPLADNVQDLAKQIQDALPWKNDPWDTRGGPSVSDAYKALFKKSDDTGLPALQTGQNDSIAIQAAWREVALTVPEDPPSGRIRPDQQKLDWFVGFLEGRALVKAPAWWTAAVHEAGAHRRDNIYFPSPTRERSPYNATDLAGIFAPRDTAVSEKAGRLTIQVGDHKIQAPTSILKKSDDGTPYRGISAAFGKTRCYVALHGDIGNPFPLYCFDRETGTESWKSRVWGSWGGGSGKGHFWVSVVESNDRVVVFGHSGSRIHVEAFTAEDGANLFRFASSY